MRSRLLAGVVALWIPWSTLSGPPAGGTGGVEGTVIDLVGQPVVGVNVYAFLPDRPGERVGTLGTTNSEGRFSISGLRAGVYTLSAVGETAGYPDRVSYFYETERPLPQAKVDGASVARGIVIQVGPKAAKVVGRVEDAETGHGLPNSLIIFYRAGDSQEYMGTTPNGRVSDRHADPSRFNILVPANKPFRIKARASGYETWYYGLDGSEEHAAPIQLKSGAIKEIVIRLRPSTQAP